MIVFTSFIIEQSDFNEFITSNSPQTTTSLSTYSYGVIIPQASNAKWVWDTDSDKPGCNQNINITKNFTNHAIIINSYFIIYSLFSNY